MQMSDTNLHHVREVMDEVFGPECFVSQISFQTTSGFQTRTLATLGDFLLWYARDPDRLTPRGTPITTSSASPSSPMPAA